MISIIVSLNPATHVPKSFHSRNILFSSHRISLLKVPVIKYVTQPPTTTATTSCLSSRKGVTNNETKATPTQSPTTCHNPLLSEKSPTGGRLSRKHVQFPDTSTLPSQVQRPGEHIRISEVRWLKIKFTKSGTTREKKRNVASSISVYLDITSRSHTFHHTCHFH